MHQDNAASPAENFGRLDVDFPRSAGAEAVRFSLEAGQGLAIMGPSGIGKTTLLRKIADLDPHEGHAAIGNRSRTSMAAPVWRQKVMFVSSQAGWWAPTVRGHFGAIDDDLRLVMEQTGLPHDKLDMPPHLLSSGEAQRLVLIRALMRRPQFLLLDEPTSALDADTAFLIEAVLSARMAAGTGIVLVTHDRTQADRLANDTLILKAADR